MIYNIPEWFILGTGYNIVDPTLFNTINKLTSGWFDLFNQQSSIWVN